MRVKYSFICEAANASNSGNLNVLGIFDNINATSFPVKISKIVYVICIEFHRSEMGNHRFKVNFIDSDGKSMFSPLEDEIIVNEGSISSNIILNFDGVVMPQAGDYAIDLTVDNQHVSTDNLKITYVEV